MIGLMTFTSLLSAYTLGVSSDFGGFSMERNLGFWGTNISVSRCQFEIGSYMGVVLPQGLLILYSGNQSTLEAHIRTNMVPCGRKEYAYEYESPLANMGANNKLGCLQLSMLARDYHCQALDGDVALSNSCNGGLIENRKNIMGGLHKGNNCDRRNFWKSPCTSHIQPPFSAFSEVVVGVGAQSMEGVYDMVGCSGVLVNNSDSLEQEKNLFTSIKGPGAYISMSGKFSVADDSQYSFNT